MHTISIVEVKNYRGGRLSVPEFDVNGEVAKEPILTPDGQPILDTQTGEPITKVKTSGQANVLDCLDYFLMDFPKQRLTIKHIAEAMKLQQLIANAREQNLDHLDLEDATYDWLIAQLKNDQIGVQMFGLNVTNLLNVMGATI